MQSSLLRPCRRSVLLLQLATGNRRIGLPHVIGPIPMSSSLQVHGRLCSTSRELAFIGTGPPTLRERIRNFPQGVKGLLKDILMYKNIHDASKTPLNAWTINHPLDHRKSRKQTNRGYFIFEDEIRPGRIPRRQYEQQRRLRADIRTVVPLVLLWIPPIIGFLPPILAATCPRQVLSRQFLNEYEVWTFAQIEFDQRRQFFEPLGDFLCSMARADLKDFCVDKSSRDAAGPLIDPLTFYSVFSGHAFPTHPEKLRTGIIRSCEDLSRDYLETLCLSIGVHQHLPVVFSRLVTQFSISWWLRKQVHRLSEIICHDDSLLLEEGHDLNGCNKLTDVEVLDACLMRGLPIVDVSVEEMRICLTNHLKMVAQVRKRMRGRMTEGFRLFTMHLAPFRHYPRKRMETKQMDQR